MDQAEYDRQAGQKKSEEQLHKEIETACDEIRENAEQEQFEVSTEDIQKAKAEGKGVLAKLISQIATRGDLVLGEEQIVELKKVYGQAMNNHACPCDSGNNFKTCCKPDWLALKFRLNAMGKLGKQDAKDVAKMAEYRPIVTIAVNAQGQIKTDLTKLGKSMQMMHLADIIHRVYQNYMLELSLYASRNMMIEEMSAVAKEQESPNKIIM